MFLYNISAVLAAAIFAVADVDLINVWLISFYGSLQNLKWRARVCVVNCLQVQVG